MTFKDEAGKAAEEIACRADMEVGLRAELKVAALAGVDWATKRIIEALGTHILDNGMIVIPADLWEKIFEVKK